jgi:hypothetical protein
VDPDEQVTDCETIQILFQYPPTHPVKQQFFQSGGFTTQQLYKAIVDGYTKISKQEGSLPGRIPGLWWLVIEGVVEHKPGVFSLQIGT